MAQKLTSAVGYLTDFTNGQGVGRPAYANYPADLDTNFGLISASVNSLVDEVNSARLVDSQLTYDALLRPIHVANGSVGRMSTSEARGTFTTTQVTVTSGRIYVGRRINVIGATLTQITTGGAAANNYVAVDANGNLSISLTPGTQVFDLIILTRSGGVITAMTENLDFNQNEPLASGYMANRIFEKRRGATLAGGQQPPFRLVSIAGVEEDAGLSYFGVNHFRWQSERDGGPGSGNSVNAAEFTAFGQLALNEQGRIHAIRSTNQSIALGAGFTAVTWDTPVVNSAAGTGANPRTWRREPASYFANPFLAASGATLTVPNDVDLRGTWLWTAALVMDTSAGIATVNWIEAQIRATNGTATNIAFARHAVDATTTAFTLAGMMDLIENDTIQLQIRHGNAGAGVNLTSARIAGIMIGGPV